MFDLKTFESELADTRKLTSYSDMIREIASWQPVALYKVGARIQRYPESDRIGPLISADEYESTESDRIRTHAPEGNTFFERFGKLLKTTPLLPLVQSSKDVNAEFTDSSGNVSNAYLSFIISDSENIYHSFSVKTGSRDIFESVAAWDNNSEIFHSSGITKSSRVFYSRYIDTSSDIWFSTNLVGCSDCLFCNGLTNQKYHINNIAYSPEEYEQRKEQFLIQKNEFASWYAKMPKQSLNLSSSNVTGNFLQHCENIENGEWLYHVRNSRNVFLVGGNSYKENMYDVVAGGATGDMYGVLHATYFSEFVYCSIRITESVHIYYSMHLRNCSYCFGCVGLMNRQFCIFNVEYSKEEWHAEVAKLVTQMQASGEFGQFFPGNLCPFYFNDTLAYLVGDFSQDTAIQHGYLWRAEELSVGLPEGARSIAIVDLPNDSYGESICDQIIIDSEGRPYRILPEEVRFCKKWSLPLPITHGLERMRDGLRS